MFLILMKLSLICVLWGSERSIAFLLIIMKFSSVCASIFTIYVNAWTIFDVVSRKYSLHKDQRSLHHDVLTVLHRIIHFHDLFATDVQNSSSFKSPLFLPLCFHTSGIVTLHFRFIWAALEYVRSSSIKQKITLNKSSGRMEKYPWLLSYMQ